MIESSEGAGTGLVYCVWSDRRHVCECERERERERARERESCWGQRRASRQRVSRVLQNKHGAALGPISGHRGSSQSDPRSLRSLRSLMLLPHGLFCSKHTMSPVLSLAPSNLTPRAFLSLSIPLLRITHLVHTATTNQSRLAAKIQFTLPNTSPVFSRSSSLHV